MTPADQQAIDRLTADLDRDSYEYPIGCTLVSRADLRAALSLLRPVASVEGEVVRVDPDPGMVSVFYGLGDAVYLADIWPGATVGQRVRVAVHAVGEEVSHD